MKLYYLDKNYLEYIHKNVDKEVLFSHTSDITKGRANVCVARMKYKSTYQDFAIPFKGEIQRGDKNAILVSVSKKGSTQTGGFKLNKMMPVDSSVLHELPVYNGDFKKISQDINGKEFEFRSRALKYIDDYVSGERAKFSTNIDRELEFLNARTELLNSGQMEVDIYSEKFSDNIIKANILKEQRSSLLSIIKGGIGNGIEL